MSSQDRQFLIIDADSKVREQIRGFLNSLGYNQVKDCSRVKEAIEFLNESPVDCIIADWNTPNASSYTLLKLIRAQKRFEHLSFILMTEADSDSAEEKIVSARKLQVDGFLLKPFDAHTLSLSLKA
jgi:two-component system chemotaxis response regulator CheY